jgi:hypothetical protein
VPQAARADSQAWSALLALIAGTVSYLHMWAVATSPQLVGQILDLMSQVDANVL